MLWQRLKISTSLSAFFMFLLVVGCLTNDCSAALILGNPTSLGILISQQGNVVAGDKKFTEFSYLGTGDMPSAGNVNVVPIQDDLGNYGIRFQGAFADLPGNGGSDSLITYKVEVNDPNLARKIIDVHLAGNPNLLGDIGTVSVTETFIPDSPITIEIHDNGGNSVVKQSDQAVFPAGYRVLRVQKDILILAGDAPGTISFVDQTFSQIPEPTTIMMSMIGLVGLAGFMRRRERS